MTPSSTARERLADHVGQYVGMDRAYELVDEMLIYHPADLALAMTPEQWERAKAARKGGDAQ